MRVGRDGWVVSEEGDPFTVRRDVSPPPFSARIVPEIVVVHYGVTSALPALLAAQRAQKYWAHFSIDGWWHERDEAEPFDLEKGQTFEVVQALPTTALGSHAGQSEWRGRDRCNRFSIGIEIANPGPLARDAEGVLRTTYKQRWPESDAIEARHKLHGTAPGGGAPLHIPYRYWAKYSDQEYDILINLIRAIRAAHPTIVAVVGHDEIARPWGRKVDPGPAMDLEFVRRESFR